MSDATATPDTSSCKMQDELQQNVFAKKWISLAERAVERAFEGGASALPSASAPVAVAAASASVAKPDKDPELKFLKKEVKRAAERAERAEQLANDLRVAQAGFRPRSRTGLWMSIAGAIGMVVLLTIAVAFLSVLGRQDTEHKFQIASRDTADVQKNVNVVKEGLKQATEDSEDRDAKILTQLNANVGAIAALGTDVGNLKGGLATSRKRLDELDKALDEHIVGSDKRMDEADKRTGGMDGRLGKVEKRVRKRRADLVILKLQSASR